jgi:type I restriction enzyme S subunit
MKTYQSYKPSGIEWIGDIPEKWKKSKYKYNISILSGFPFKSELFDKIEGFPLMRIRDISSGNIETYYKGEYQKEYIVKKGDIVIGMDGEFNIREWDNNDILLNQRCCKIKKTENLLLKYVYYTLPFDLRIINDLTYYTTVKHLSVDDLKNISCITPPLQEQQQIVNYLDEKTTIIDKLISIKERKIELLKEQRKSLVNEVVTKGLNPFVKMKDSGVEWIGEIPENWSFVRLGVLGKFSKGKGITKDKIKEKGFPCIRNGEIYTTYNLRFSKPNSFIDEQTINESIKVKKGTLFFTGDGETLEEIGKCVVYLGDEEIYVGGGINVFTPNNEKVSPIYLSYVMSSTSSVYQKSKGGKGEIVVHIYSKQLRDIQFGLPKLDEQQKIVDYLDKHTKEIDDLVQLEQNKIELLKEYRQSLISEVITGKIKVI